MGSHFDLISNTTARKQMGCVAIYQQMPDNLSVSQRALWRYRRTDKGRANMKRANSNEKGKARDQRYKARNRKLISERNNSAQKERGWTNQKNYRAEHLEEVREKDRIRQKSARLTWTAEKKEELKIKNRERQKKYLKTPRGHLLRDNKLPKEIRFQLMKWSNKIRAKFDWTCVFCGSMVDIEAHHVKPRALFPELMFDLDNGVASCYDCHHALHELNVIGGS